jgi:hypothetical protein
MADVIATKLAAIDAPKQDNRPRYKYSIPEKSRQFPTDPKSVTFVPLRVEDEQDALKVAEAKGSTRSFQAELVRRSVVALDGKTINWEKGDDAWLERVSPKVRELIYIGYRKANENADEEKAAFLAGEEIEV